MKNLLLIACSNRKLQADELLRALDRYDGGTYRVIKKMQRDNNFPNKIDIKIISAKYGLIDAKTFIPYYEQKMTVERSLQLKEQIQQSLNQCFTTTCYSEIYIDLGKEYLITLGDVITQTNCKAIISNGRIGERLSNVKKWLTKIKEIEDSIV